MDVIEATRALGKAIQEDERYKAYMKAKEANDNDAELQQLIGEFNLKRQNMQLEMSKEPEQQDKDKLQQMNKDLQESYEKVMGNANMANFAIVKSAVDQMLQEVNGIIGLCCDGEDPETCQPHSCGSDCSTCGGCH